MESVVRLARESLEAIETPARVDPVALALGLCSTLLTAVVFNPLFDAVAIISSLALIALSGCRFRVVLAAISYPAVVSLVASAPMLLQGVLVDLPVRAITASLAAYALLARLGWRGVVESLTHLGAPAWLVDSTRLFPIVLRRLLREFLVVSAARRARLLRGKCLTLEWLLQASVAGELLMRSLVVARRVSMAVRARSLGCSRTRRDPTLDPDYASRLAFALVTALGVYVALAGG